MTLLGHVEKRKKKPAAKPSGRQPKKAPPAQKGARAICGAPRFNGRGLCQLTPGFGTDHLGVGRCSRHGGNLPSGIKAAGVVLAEESVALGRTVMGMPVKIEPNIALLRCVEVAAGELEYCTRRMQEEIEEGNEMETVWGTQVFKGWIRERQRSIERLAKLSKMAIDAGVAEREVRAKEATAGILAVFAQGLLDGLGLTAEQAKRAPAVVRDQLLLMAGEPGEVVDSRNALVSGRAPGKVRS